MKVKSLKNFFLYNGKQISINEVVDLHDSIAIDLIRGKYVIEYKEKNIKRKSKAGDE